MKESAYNIFFHTLANKTRLAIIFALKNGEMNVSELTKRLSFKQSTISHNLKRLISCQFVHMRKDGQFRYYSLNRDTIVPLLKLMDKHVNTYCIKLCDKCDQ